MKKTRKFNKLWLIPALILFAAGVYSLPPVKQRLEPRMQTWYARIRYMIKPPDEAVFQPGQGGDLTIETVIATTRAEFALTLTPQVISTPTPQIGPTLRPTITPTPIPSAVSLPGVKYVDQHERWNYCGPANLTMALNFWGWTGNRDDVARVVKPGSSDTKKNFIDRGYDDKNVMPYELVDFVNDHTEYKAILRYGGNIELIKKLIAAGYPVVIEKGYYERDYTGKIDWLGHYLFTTGYDDARGGFIVQDAYLKPGKNLLSEYDIYEEGWRSFNYIFMVVYPPAKEADVMQVLGNWADEQWAKRHALEIADQEINTLEDIDLFFAWFNKGTSHVQLQEYVDAASAYDRAFSIYSKLDQTENRRPFRMMWYQTGPYFAYYYAGRYQDVINLANTTLNDTIAKPTLEESLLWRGRAYYVMGQTQRAIDDFRAALAVHVDWPPAVQALQDLGVQP